MDQAKTGASPTLIGEIREVLHSAEQAVENLIHPHGEAPPGEQSANSLSVTSNPSPATLPVTPMQPLSTPRLMAAPNPAVNPNAAGGVSPAAPQVNASVPVATAGAAGEQGNVLLSGSIGSNGIASDAISNGTSSVAPALDPNGSPVGCVGCDNPIDCAAKHTCFKAFARGLSSGANPNGALPAASLSASVMQPSATSAQSGDDTSTAAAPVAHKSILETLFADLEYMEGMAKIEIMAAINRAKKLFS